jgi:hypothetical protein
MVVHVARLFGGHPLDDNLEESLLELLCLARYKMMLIVVHRKTYCIVSNLEELHMQYQDRGYVEVRKHACVSALS